MARWSNAGFAMGGYCPGTSVAGLFSGRLDALVFIVGVLLDTTGFAVFYGAALRVPEGRLADRGR